MEVSKTDGAILTDAALAVLAFPHLENVRIRIVTESDEPDADMLERCRNFGNDFCGILIDMLGDERGKAIMRRAINLMLDIVCASRESERKLVAF